VSDRSKCQEGVTVTLGHVSFLVPDSNQQQTTSYLNISKQAAGSQDNGAHLRILAVYGDRKK